MEEKEKEEDKKENAFGWIIDPIKKAGSEILEAGKESLTKDSGNSIWDQIIKGV